MENVKIFARIVDNSVVEIVPPLPLTAGWVDNITAVGGDVRNLYGYNLSEWVEITDMDPQPEQNWMFSDGKFSPPVELYDLTEQRYFRNKSDKDFFLKTASEQMIPLVMAMQLNNQTEDEKSLALKWQNFYREIQKIDIKSVEIIWPEFPQ